MRRRWLCWLPLASLLAIEVYVRQFEGWGAWASAPLLLIPALIGLAIVILSLFDIVAENRAGKIARATILCTVIASLPIVWLFVRRFLV